MERWEEYSIAAEGDHPARDLTSLL